MALFLTLRNPAAKPYKQYEFAKQCKVFFKRGTSPNKLIIKALQYPLFCNAKEPVLHGKSACFAMQYRLFCKVEISLLPVNKIFFTKLNISYTLNFLYL